MIKSKRRLYIYDFKVNYWPGRRKNNPDVIGFYFLIERSSGHSRQEEYNTLYAACRAAKRLSVSYHFEKIILSEK